MDINTRWGRPGAREGIPVMNLINRLLILPAHVWVWIVNKNIIPPSVWAWVMVWRTKK